MACGRRGTGSAPSVHSHNRATYGTSQSEVKLSADNADLSFFLYLHANQVVSTINRRWAIRGHVSDIVARQVGTNRNIWWE
jgi:hypothetical protein